LLFYYLVKAYKKQKTCNQEPIIFHVQSKSQEQFEKKVKRIVKQQNAKLFHCYVAGDIFKIATANKV
jgi:hypothetical protein